MKILASFITLVLIIISDFIFAFLMYYGTYGYRKEHADKVQSLYAIWIIISAILMTVLSFFLTKYFLAKSLKNIGAVVISVIIAVGLGAAINLVGVILGANVVEYLRVSSLK